MRNMKRSFQHFSPSTLQIFQKSRDHLKILGAIRVIQGKCFVQNRHKTSSPWQSGNWNLYTPGLTKIRNFEQCSLLQGKKERRERKTSRNYFLPNVFSSQFPLYVDCVGDVSEIPFLCKIVGSRRG